MTKILLLLSLIALIGFSTIAYSAPHATQVNMQKWLTDSYERDMELCLGGSSLYCGFAERTLMELEKNLQSSKSLL